MKHFTFSLKMLLLSLCVVGGVNSAWGTTTYKLVQVTSVEAGGLYVFEQGGYVMNNSVSSSSALETTNTYNTTGLAGTETYVWTLESATNGYYMKNVSRSSNQYLNNTSKTNVSFGSKSSIWAFNFQTDNTVLIQNKSNSDRFLGDNGSNAYKAYATSNIDDYPHAIKVYKLVEEDNSTVSAPKFDPIGGTYNTTKTVALSTTTDGASIYYTTDGTNPSTSSSVYSTPIPVNQTMTIKAFAVRSGLTNSDVASATYTLKAVAPQIAAEGETYKTVTLSTTTDGASIYYTTNGDEPTSTSTLYSQPFVVGKSCTVKAVAIKAGWTNSDVTSKSYVITLGAPNITNNGNKVTITATEGANIYYTIDGSTPDNTSTSYTGVIELTESPTTVKAIAYDSYENVSEVSQKTIAFVAGDVVWSEDFSAYKKDDVPTCGTNATYVITNGASDSKIYEESSCGGDSPELLLNKKATASSTTIGSMTATINLRRYYGNMTLVFKSNYPNRLTVTSSTAGVTIGTATDDSNNKTKTVAIKDVPEGTENLVLVISNTSTSNARVDDFELYATSRSDIPYVTVSAVGYATYTTDLAVDYSQVNGVKAYVVSAVSDDNVTLTEVESVPANTPVVIEAAAGKYQLAVAESATAPATNYLKVSTGNVKGDGSTIFALANNEGVGFYVVGNGVVIPAGKCYLDGTASAAKARLGFSFEGEDATAITAIEATEAVNNGVIYNLSGQRVVKPLKGIYIQNGKKILVK